MRLRNVLSIILLVLITSKVNGQQNLREIKIGDELPMFAIPKMINNIKKNENTTNYKNKLLIIDFWATNCSGCVEALPKMEYLQKKIGSKVKILPVTYENEQKVVSFLKKNKYTKNLNIPIVVEDIFFRSYFKHKYIPHEVWVYKGKVIAITEPEYVDEQSIKKVLNGEVINFPLKYDYYTFDSNKPLFPLNVGQIDTNLTAVNYAAVSDAKIKYSSALLPGRFGIVRDSIKKTVRTYFLNQSIYSLYAINMMKLIDSDTLQKPSHLLQPNQVIWEVSDRSRYRYNPSLGYKQDWMINNGICFESVHPYRNKTDQEVAQSIISDLNKLFGLNVRWERRKEKVLVLIKNTNKPVLKNDSIVNSKYHIKDIIYNLNQEEDNPYIFNDTNDGETVIKLNVDTWKDLPTIRRKLQVYNFDLKQEERVVDKLVFTETDGGRLVDGLMQSEAQKRQIMYENLKSVNSEKLGNTGFMLKNKTKLGVRETSSGLQYKILREGTGKKPNLKSKVRVHYEGTTIDGRIFESSYLIGRPVELGVENVIKGWQEALQMMPEGSKWVLYIPSQLAYGDHTNQGKFPPNSILIFTIELLNILR